MRKLLSCVAALALCALVVLGQFPPGTPQVSQCTLFSTDSERSVEGIHLSTSSYFVRVGAKPVMLHLEFTAFAVKGLLPQYAMVSVASKASGIAVAARPSLVGPDRYAVDLPLTGLAQPYLVLVSFKSKGLWWEFVPKC